MIKIINLVADAIMTLKPNLQYTLSGSPTNEAEFNANFQRVTGEDSDGTAILSSNPSDFGITWSEIATAIEDGGTLAMMQLRKERDEKLAESDWTQSPDSPLTDSQKASWATYRQSLRDITDGATTLEDVKWPTKPE